MALRFSAALLSAALMIPGAYAATLAPTPPMGWNSWDAYGFSIDEKEFKADVQVLHGLKQYGWNYAVIDEGWYFKDPLAQPEARVYNLDAYGRLVPDPARYPSAASGGGLKPIADSVHAQGLKFGIHILRGIPKDAVRKNLPIANGAYHAADAADTSDVCPWDNGNYGVRDDAAGQAYYDSIIELYAKWGVDFLKVDCISSHPYKADEIRMIAKAIRKSGRPIVLSLSPGPTSLSHAEEVGEYSQMWRIANDIWDGWTFPGPFPKGLLSAFDNLAKWSQYAKPGNWPDADMLPWGSLRPHPGWGPPRQSRLTQDEQRTQFTLWSIARSPLILGANLTQLDGFTRSLITNREVIALNQKGASSHEVPLASDQAAQLRAWSAETGGSHAKRYIAVFNLTDAPLQKDLDWKVLLGSQASHAYYDVWNRKQVASAQALHVDIPPHGCALLRVAR